MLSDLVTICSLKALCAGRLFQSNHPRAVSSPGQPGSRYLGAHSSAVSDDASSVARPKPYAPSTPVLHRFDMFPARAARQEPAAFTRDAYCYPHSSLMAPLRKHILTRARLSLLGHDPELIYAPAGVTPHSMKAREDP